MSSDSGRAPDPFSLSPLLSLLPELGNAARLEAVSSSLFVHFESVERQRELGEPTDAKVRIAAEAAMLRHVLDWLSGQRDEGGIDE